MNIRPFTLRDWIAARPIEPPTQHARLPKNIVWAIWFICAAPLLFNLAGVSFASNSLAYDPALYTADTSIDVLYLTLTGSFTHTILEWSAFCTAIFTVVLAFIHFRLSRDVTTPVIGVQLIFTR